VNDRKTVHILYKKLLTLYPLRFKEQLGKSMEQTFSDLYEEKRQTQKGLFGFILRTFIETATGIAQEHILLLTRGDIMKNISTNPKSAALIGFLFALPFLILNTIVGSRIEPFYSLMRPDTHTGPFEYVLLAFVLLLIPIGGFIAARPMLRTGVNGEQKFYLLNTILAAILIAGGIALFVGLGSEIYRCDVLQIPNCD
jgi:hypothetical protein